MVACEHSFSPYLDFMFIELEAARQFILPDEPDQVPSS
jgi:hypothetical protein